MKQQIAGADPLQQLRDIHLPDPVGWWPPAPGWWVLAAFFVGILTVLVAHWLKQQRRRKYRHEALQILAELKTVYDAEDNSREYLQNLLRLLRRVVKTAYPEKHWDTLSGNQLLGKLGLEIQGNIDLDALLYANRPEQTITASQLERFAASLQRWIQQHRVPG